MSERTVLDPSVVRLDTARDRPTRPTRWYSPRNLTRAALPVAALAVWHLLSSTGVVDPLIFPSPLTVAEALGDLVRTGELQAALPVSLARAGTGLLLGLLIGITFGVLNGLSRRAEEIFDSSFQILRQVPFIAMVPLFIIWFGIDEQFKVIVITLACIFPAYLNTYAGVRHVDGRLVEAARVFGLGRLQVVRQVILPAAAPAILVGVRFAMGTSLLALVLAEQVNSRSGIGHIISVAQGALRIDIITGAVLVYAVLGIAVDVLMRFLERRLIPWK